LLIVSATSNAARTLWICVALALICVPAAKAQPSEPPALTAAIPAQALSQSLITFAQQTGLDLVYESAVVGDLRSRAVPAGLSADRALKRLLKGTDLRFEFVNTRTVVIQKAERPGNRPSESTPAASPEQEVLVTASILRERPGTTPMSQVVWTSDAMAVSGIKDITTLASLTPGVEFDSYSDNGAGFETNISIRAINARDGSAVAFYLDDVPLPTDRLTVFGRAFPFTFDLSRVEVLRGPQGVLLGEGAEGGGVRFVTTLPSVSHFDGSVHGEFASTDQGAPSYELGGEVGGPLVDEIVGFRLWAWSRESGGYVDRVNPFTAAIVDPNANSSRQRVFSAAMSVVSTDVLRVTPAIRYQSLDVNDTSSFYTYLSNPGEGVLRNGKLSSQPYSDAFTLTSLGIFADLGWSTLKFDAARLTRGADATYDDDRDSNQSSFGKYCPPDARGDDYPSACFLGVAVSETLSQSMWYGGFTLASSRLQDRITWLAGAGYTWSRYSGSQNGLGTTAFVNTGNPPATTPAGPTMSEVTLINTTRQVELHGLLNVRLSKQLEASFGARFDRESFDFAWNSVNPSTVSSPPLELPPIPTVTRRSLHRASVSRFNRTTGTSPT